MENQPYFATINESYFDSNPHLKEILHNGSRLYLGVVIEVNSCRCFVPLRSEIKTESKYRKAGYPLPSTTRKNAGLDFRKLLVISNMKDVKIQNKVEIPSIQKNKIYDEFDKISARLNSYVQTYIREVNRNRANDNFLYKFSTLKNYHVELGLK